MISERSLAVLRAIVQDYVASREPVGSKTIVERHSFGVSAATIRNDMALLEEEELIAAPHTSSGRIPTDKGYRMFVDQLAAMRPLSAAQRQAIDTFLGESSDLDELLARTVRLMAQLTKQLAVVQVPNFSSVRVQHVELVAVAATRLLCIVISDAGQVEQRVTELTAPITDAELSAVRSKVNALVAGQMLADAATAVAAAAGDAELARSTAAQVLRAVGATITDQVKVQTSHRLVVAGAANLVRTEQDFSGSILGVIETIEEQVVLLKLFGEMATEQHEVAVRIGRENTEQGLAETSVVSSAFSLPGRDISRLAVVGPTRMDYSSNIAAVRAVARYLSRALGSE
ncbi:MAG TPA: heat-inducible transcriptional repressor HrcA [Candidatus Lumbricidophila sp.]|nr:heat-inducible transcriptional repressor HrcA [Candidatus Lumbricidophila sp.]